MQDGKIDITSRDITTNLPYVADAHLVFDHHESETKRNDVSVENYVIDADAASAARVVWRHYGGNSVFPTSWNDMMEAVDKADSAQYTMDEVLTPNNWELLNLLILRCMINTGLRSKINCSVAPPSMAIWLCLIYATKI